MIEIKKIRTDNFKIIYESLSNLHLPVSALDVRKVRNIVKTIYEGGEINVQITKNIDNLENKDKVLAIGTINTISWNYDTVSELIANYFDIIDEANSDRLKLIDKYKISKSQFFPMFGFSTINENIKSASEKKKNQIEILETYFQQLNEKDKIQFSNLNDVLDKEFAKYKRVKIMFYNVYTNNISLEALKNYLLQVDFNERFETDYRRLICLYDYKTYGELDS